MSAFGSFEACTTVCQCHDCFLRGVICGPCMDCVGEAWDSESAKEEYCNGYIRIGEECPSKEKELKRYLEEKERIAKKQKKLQIRHERMSTG